MFILSCIVAKNTNCFSIKNDIAFGFALGSFIGIGFVLSLLVCTLLTIPALTIEKETKYESLKYQIEHIDELNAVTTINLTQEISEWNSSYKRYIYYSEKWYSRDFYPKSVIKSVGELELPTIRARLE